MLQLSKLFKQSTSTNSLNNVLNWYKTFKTKFKKWTFLTIQQINQLFSLITCHKCSVTWYKELINVHKSVKQYFQAILFNHGKSLKVFAGLPVKSSFFSGQPRFSAASVANSTIDTLLKDGWTNRSKQSKDIKIQLNIWLTTALILRKQLYELQ